MKINFLQTIAYFLMKKLEKLSRKNISTYYWSRKLLPLYVYLTGAPHEKDFLILKKIPVRPGIFLDVGANDGVSVLSIRSLNKTNPILSLEPNPNHEGRLHLLTKIIKNYQFKLVGAGEKPEKLTLYSPIYKGYPLLSYATLKPELLDLAGTTFTKKYRPELLDFIKTTVEIIAIDDLNLDISFVKIDAEGNDFNVLKGMLVTIKRCKPVIMIENGHTSLKKINGLLEGFDYCLVNAETAENITEKLAPNDSNLVFWPTGLVPIN
jgi:FkbM family methyltransferase